MPYKDVQKRNEKALEYYYKNKEKVLKYQTDRWSKKYQADADFRKKRQLRDKSRIVFGRSLKGEICAECGATEDLQRHHPSYESISFIILCRQCHNHTHKGKVAINQEAVAF